jgi:DNA topoisomerase 2-associated protein PAT1
MFSPPHRHMMSQVFVNQRYLPDIDYDDDEEITGWMTEREKDWVIKVQQSQVRTDNPYMDDYYHYVRFLLFSHLISC